MSKIQRTKKSNQSLELSKLIIESIEEKKGEEIVCLDLRNVNETIADFFIICSADNTTQVKAIADFITVNVKNKTSEKPWHTEGYRNLEWILVDYVNVVAHVFLEKQRKFYQLEDLWSDANNINLKKKQEKKPLKKQKVSIKKKVSKLKKTKKKK